MLMDAINTIFMLLLLSTGYSQSFCIQTLLNGDQFIRTSAFIFISRLVLGDICKIFYF